MQWLRRKARVAGAMLALFVVLGLGVGPIALASDPHGCDPGNLIPNCNFDSFYQSGNNEIPQGWTPFVLSGSLQYTPASPETGPGEGFRPPSLRMWSDGDTFKAGIYTQVNGLTPGTTYKASIGWAAPRTESFGRWLGIDPTGGTDPTAPTVVLGPKHYGWGKFGNDRPGGSDPNLDVRAVAQSSTVTVFLFVDQTSGGVNEIFLDALGLYPDASVPVAPPPAPTAPPAPVKTAAPPAATKPLPPTPTDTVTPTATATATPTQTATAAPTATPTASSTPTQTLTPSVTPTSTLPPRPTATPGASTAQPAASRRGSSLMLWGGLVALGGAGALGAVLVAKRRR